MALRSNLFTNHETKEVTSPWPHLYLPLLSAGFSKACDLVCFTEQPPTFLTNPPCALPLPTATAQASWRPLGSSLVTVPGFATLLCR